MTTLTSTFVITAATLNAEENRTKSFEAYKPCVSDGNDEIKERFQPSLLRGGVFLNLQNKHFGGLYTDRGTKQQC